DLKQIKKIVKYVSRLYRNRKLSSVVYIHGCVGRKDETENTQKREFTSSFFFPFGISKISKVHFISSL
ncbi:MAG: hypothetical protein ACI8RD_011311, partial [Bacillariaceae sp.]